MNVSFSQIADFCLTLNTKNTWILGECLVCIAHVVILHIEKEACTVISFEKYALNSIIYNYKFHFQIKMFEFLFILILYYMG